MEAERMTLVPSRLASRGFRFIFIGPSSLCKDCKYRNTCVEGMEVGRLYEVVDVSERKRFQCPLHEEVSLASVRKASLEVAVPKSLVEGATILYKSVDCKSLSCENYRFCKPEGLKPGDKLSVLREKGVIRGCDTFQELRIYEVEIK
ncbi:MAG: UPF0179 family protein [Candidatus Korarchaeum sp.]